MKNIYNLVSDAFTYADLDEQLYGKTVEDEYKITIWKNTDPEGPRLFIFIYMLGTTIYDITYANQLLSGSHFNRFAQVFENEIP